MTFKQLEALYWIAQLGGFSQAAARLHTSQSALSKRIQELETLLKLDLFDRSHRAARLTDKGEELFVHAKRLLDHRSQIVEELCRPEVVERRLRLGVTELTALTWLPRLVNLIEDNYPRVTIEPHVEMSATLRDKLMADEVDIAIVPNAFPDSNFVSRAVGTVENAWMCKPGTFDTLRPMRISELANHRLLVQGDRSGTGLVYSDWLQSLGVHMKSTITSNNLIAQIGMTVSGLGISSLPRRCLSPLVEDGRLQVLKVTPRLPDIAYVALRKRDQQGGFLSSIVEFAHEACNFDRMFQAGA